MKARLVPVYFKSERTERFGVQLNRLRELLSDMAEILDEQALGDKLPECEAVLFPEILGEAYRSVDEFLALDKPLLIITSEFATVSMWDWEISNFLKSKGLDPVTPYSLDDVAAICRILSAKRKMAESKFLIFQDNPGEGFQPEIFKSFYWWEDECTRTIKERFGTDIERRSLKALGEKAAEVPDAEAEKVWNSWDYPQEEGFEKIRGIHAAKFYIAMNEQAGQ